MLGKFNVSSGGAGPGSEIGIYLSSDKTRVSGKHGVLQPPN